MTRDEFEEITRRRQVAADGAEYILNCGEPAAVMDQLIWSVASLNDDFAHGRSPRVLGEGVRAIEKALEEMRREMIEAMSNHERLEFIAATRNHDRGPISLK